MPHTLVRKKPVQVAKNSLEVIRVGDAFGILQQSSYKMVAAPLFETAKQANLVALNLKNTTATFKSYRVKTYGG